MSDLVEAVRKRIESGGPMVDVCGLPLRAAPPATSEAVDAAERRIGFPLPALLRRLYVEVANGGFGPGYGLIGVEGGFLDEDGQTLAELHEALSARDPSDPRWAWPERHLPICHWGCAVWSVLDCTRPEAPVLFAEPGLHGAEEDEGDDDDDEAGDDATAPAAAAPPSILWPSRPSFDAWMRAWLDGETLWQRRGAT